MDKELTILVRNGSFKIGNAVRAFYCSLPYIEGQRYTFGRAYPEEVENLGEFIFLTLIMYDVNPEDGSLFPHFQINCRSSRYFIKDCNLQGYDCTFLNDAAVTKETEIRVGDHLHVIWMSRKRLKKNVTKHIPTQWNSDLDVLFLFRKATFIYYLPIYGLDGSFSSETSNNEVTDNTLCHPVLQNTLVLSTIFKYTSTWSLKACRLVCRRWEAEAATQLKNKTQLSLEIPGPYKFPESSMRLFLFRRQIEAFSHPSWKINISFYRIWDEGRGFMKFENDLNKFFTNANFDVKRLHLVMPIDFERYSNYIDKILSSVRDTLQELRLDIRHEDEGTQEFPNVELPHVKSLIVALESNRSLMRYVIRHFRHTIRCIHIKAYGEMDNDVWLEEMALVEFSCLKEIKLGRIDQEGFQLLRKVKDVWRKSSFV